MSCLHCERHRETIKGLMENNEALARAHEALQRERDELAAEVDRQHQISLDVMRERDVLREALEGIAGGVSWASKNLAMRALVDARKAREG